MSKCAFCGAETSLYVNGMPICLVCDSDAARKKRASTAKPLTVRDSKPPHKQNVMEDDRERTVRVLFVSHCESDHEYMRRFFARTNWKLHPVQTYREAATLLASEPIAVVIIDGEMTGGTWQDLLQLARACPSSPVVVITYRFAEDMVLDSLLNQGAYDVLAKPFEETEISQVIAFAWLRWRSKRMSARTHESDAQLA